MAWSSGDPFANTSPVKTAAIKNKTNVLFMTAIYNIFAK